MVGVVHNGKVWVREAESMTNKPIEVLENLLEILNTPDVRPPNGSESQERDKKAEKKKSSRPQKKFNTGTSGQGRWQGPTGDDKETAKEVNRSKCKQEILASRGHTERREISDMLAELRATRPKPERSHRGVVKLLHH